MNHKRARILKQCVMSRGPIVYWMSRDQRMNDNWALLYAQEIALKQKAPLLVLFCLSRHFLGATLRQYGFMLRGMQETEASLARKNIPFFLLAGEPGNMIPEFLRKHHAGILITDFDPLRVKRRWKETVASAIDLPFHEVDAHNIVPCWSASGKQEYAAYTFRPKLKKLMPEFLDEFRPLRKHPFLFGAAVKGTDWEGALRMLRVDRSVAEVRWIKPGEKEAGKALKNFLVGKLSSFRDRRNDPSLAGQSDLSPYLHFGQLSAQRVALEVKRHLADKGSSEAFLEELIVRRELSDNFCCYNPEYDSFAGFPEWARNTLNNHRRDRREYIYERDELEQAGTHDPLWNAAQREMVKRGKMHGYMRMYWAKKILEWSVSPEQAMEMAVSLNDRYELDGRDPNGYAGIAWSIGGVHDRAWGEREIFGKVRYMSYQGCRSKFDVNAYIRNVGS